MRRMGQNITNNSWQEDGEHGGNNDENGQDGEDGEDGGGANDVAIHHHFPAKTSTPAAKCQPAGESGTRRKR